MSCLSLIGCGFLFIAGMLCVLYVFGCFWVTVVRINLNISRYLLSECKWHVCSCLLPLVLCSILHISADELGGICLLSAYLVTHTHTHTCVCPSDLSTHTDIISFQTLPITTKILTITTT